MIDFHRFKKGLNPLNAVIAGAILLFVCIRVFSNNHENAFIIEAISPTETETTEWTQNIEPSQVEIQKQPDTTIISNNSTSDLPNTDDEPLAYSAELGRTFNLDAFNKLTKDELMTFSGIGDVTAQAILDYRKENGPFSDFDDLKLVKGIGEKKLQKIMTILP
jgi:competence ComEA-like helix-hairpin-helix protein